jgi:hypothetical protein
MSAKTAKKVSMHQSVRTRQRQGMVSIVWARQHVRASQRVNNQIPSFSLNASEIP